MTVLVVGGSSQIGHFLLPRLMAMGETVLAVTRVQRAASSGVTWLTGSLPDAMPETLPALAAIISYGPLLPFADWLSRAPLVNRPRIVATSSMSAQSKLDSPVPAERAVALTLRAGEDRLAEACAGRGLDWTVLRPTLIYGAGLDRSLSPIARRAMRWRVFPLPAGQGLRQPVHADDLARASILAWHSASANAQILPIGGGERLTAAQMFARVRASLPVATVPLPIPPLMLRWGRGLWPRLRGPLDRLQSNLVADNAEMQACLGLQPRPFHPGPECWR